MLGSGRPRPARRAANQLAPYCSSPLLHDFSTIQRRPCVLAAPGGVHIGAHRLGHCRLSGFMKHPG